jgi:phosphate/sulfate permease
MAGSKTLSLWSAVAIASVFEFCGAILLGGSVTKVCDCCVCAAAAAAAAAGCRHASRARTHTRQLDTNSNH